MSQVLRKPAPICVAKGLVHQDEALLVDDQHALSQVPDPSYTHAVAALQECHCLIATHDHTLPEHLFERGRFEPIISHRHHDRTVARSGPQNPHIRTSAV